MSLWRSKAAVSARRNRFNAARAAIGAKMRDERLAIFERWMRDHEKTEKSVAAMRIMECAHRCVLFNGPVHGLTLVLTGDAEAPTTTEEKR